MAVFRVVPPSNKYKDENTYFNVIEYICNPMKANYNFIMLRGVLTVESAPFDMRDVATKFDKNKGTRIRHMILSFSEVEGISAVLASKISSLLIDYYADEYQIVAAVHEDKPHVHIHIVMNTVNKNDGFKYKGRKEDYYRFIKFMKRVLYKYGISVHIEK